jgi:hypothetical protein
MYASSGKGTNLSAQEAGLSARLSLDSSRLAAKITFVVVRGGTPPSFLCLVKFLNSTHYAIQRAKYPFKIAYSYQ